MVNMNPANRHFYGCDPRPAASSERGFTLMEVLVALSVVAIALVAIYRMHSQTLFMDTRSRFDTVATMLARQKLADIAIADLSDMTIDSGDFGDDHPGYTWRIQSDIVSSDQFREDGPVLKRIQVTISRDGDASEFNLSTYRYLYE